MGDQQHVLVEGNTSEDQDERPMKASQVCSW